MAESHRTSWQSAVAPYRILLRLLVAGALGGDDFETVFLPLYKHDPTHWSTELFDVLDRFFTYVDDYCGDPELREEVQGIDEVTLRQRAKEALEWLNRIVPEM